MPICRWSVALLLVWCCCFISSGLSKTSAGIENVHVVFMNHLDIGYNGIPEVGFIANVLNRYFDIYFPMAINTSKVLRERGGTEQFIYTTHPWLVSFYLDCPIGLGLHCPNASAIASFKSAILRGDITWHAFPFNAQPEVMDASLFDFGISMAHDLDVQFKKPKKIAMSQRDVPGMTRSVIPLLRKKGVKGVTVGVNESSAPPGVPKIFLWKDLATSSDLIAMWHPGGYGGITLQDCVTFPGFSDALAFAFRTDNSGPQTVDQVLQIFSQLKQEFPGAKIFASTYDAFVLKAESIRSRLPVYTQEIGDTWVYGVPSDPLKMSLFREVSRARTECIEQGKCSINDYQMKNMSRFLIKLAEHTWGLPGVNDYQNWTNAEFEKTRGSLLFQQNQIAWLEQRKYVEHAIAALGDLPLAQEIKQRIGKLRPQVPNPLRLGYHRVPNPGRTFTCLNDQLQFALDPTNARVIRFSVKGGDGTRREWASVDRPIGEFVYTTYDAADFDAFIERYGYISIGSGFFKPNISLANPESRDWLPRIVAMWEKGNCDSFLIELQMADPQTVTYYGAPRSLWLELGVSKDTSASGISVNWGLQWFSKTSTRLAEAFWFKFNPIITSNGQWEMDKLSTPVSPLEVILNGSQHQHGVWDGVTYTDTIKGKKHTFHIQSWDAGIVSPDKATPFPAPHMDTMPSVKDGMHYNLFNNIWNTNYILWYPYDQQDPAKDALFRFSLTVS